MAAGAPLANAGLKITFGTGNGVSGFPERTRREVEVGVRNLTECNAYSSACLAAAGGKMVRSHPSYIFPGVISFRRSLGEVVDFKPLHIRDLGT